MPSFQTTRRVPYTGRQMFDLVADVERYPEFLPLCEGLTLKSRVEKADRTVLVATMTAGYKAIREQFTTRVTLLPAEQQVLVEYLDGQDRSRRLRRRFLYRLRVPLRHVGPPGRRTVRQGIPPVRRSLREPRADNLWNCAP
jgi:hypothetical protein